MKRITEERAKELVISGRYPLCQVSREVFKSIKSLLELEHLKKLSLSGLQKFDLYEVDPVILPQNAMILSLNEAITLLFNNEPIYCIRNGKTQKIYNHFEFSNIIRSCNVWGDQYVLYWLVD